MRIGLLIITLALLLVISQSGCMDETSTQVANNTSEDNKDNIIELNESIIHSQNNTSDNIDISENITIESDYPDVNQTELWIENVNMHYKTITQDLDNIMKNRTDDHVGTREDWTKLADDASNARSDSLGFNVSNGYLKVKADWEETLEAWNRMGNIAMQTGATTSQVREILDDTVKQTQKTDDELSALGIVSFDTENT